MTNSIYLQVHAGAAEQSGTLVMTTFDKNDNKLQRGAAPSAAYGGIDTSFAYRRSWAIGKCRWAMIVRLIAVLAFIGCCKPKEENSRKDSFRITGIDSVGNYYVIYAKKHGMLYKMVSRKVECPAEQKVSLNEYYDFSLVPVFGDKFGYSLLVKCYAFDDSTIICYDGDSTTSLYTTKSLDGLCVAKE